MPCGRLIVRSSRFSATHRTVRPWLPCLGWSSSMRHAPANCFASCIPMRRLCRHSTDLRALSVNHLHVIWSPDTQRLAFTFHVAAPSPSLDGIVLMNRDGTQTQVLLDQQNPFAPSYAEWDLERRMLITSNVFPLPPALAYHWGPKGTVLPGRLLSTQFLPAAPPLSPIGNPDGDASFTLWQPGLAQVISSTDPSGTSYTSHTWR